MVKMVELWIVYSNVSRFLTSSVSSRTDDAASFSLKTTDRFWTNEISESTKIPSLILSLFYRLFVNILA